MALARPISEAAPDARDTTAEFVAIYENYFDFIWRCARRLGVAERSVDDAVQDVFVVVHRRLADFEGRSTIKTWLYGIVRRVAKDHRRRADRKDRALVPAEDVLAGGPTPSDSAARSEAVAILHDILAELDDAKREVFILAELEQMTAPEIADAVGANVNTVYSRLRAARAAFDKAVARLRATERSEP